MVIFEEITEEKLHIVSNIVNSNKEYNMLENDRETRTTNELKEEFFNPETKSVFLKIDDRYIGVMDCLDENPKDHFPWLGLLMIHRDYHGKGYGKQAFEKYEEMLQESGKSTVRLGVLKENNHAKLFWKSLGFVLYETKPFKHGREVECYEKVINNN